MEKGVVGYNQIWWIFLGIRYYFILTSLCEKMAAWLANIRDSSSPFDVASWSVFNRENALGILPI